MFFINNVQSPNSGKYWQLHYEQSAAIRPKTSFPDFRRGRQWYVPQTRKVFLINHVYSLRLFLFNARTMGYCRKGCSSQASTRSLFCHKWLTDKRELAQTSGTFRDFDSLWFLQLISWWFLSHLFITFVLGNRFLVDWFRFTNGILHRAP